MDTQVTQSKANVSSAEERMRREVHEMEEFVEKMDKLMKIHKERMADIKRRRREEEMALEKQLEEELNKLMEEYTPTESK